MFDNIYCSCRSRWGKKLFVKENTKEDIRLCILLKKVNYISKTIQLTTKTNTNIVFASYDVKTNGIKQILTKRPRNFQHQEKNRPFIICETEVLLINKSKTLFCAPRDVEAECIVISRIKSLSSRITSV